MAEQSFFDKVSSHTSHVPDVLSCIANLSNDEVFTPPDVVNKMLDLLPQELFANPDTTFLDPATKTGVFLREIAKRCLEAQLPGYAERSAEISEKKALGIELDEYDIAFQRQLQEKIDHIFHKQLYGIAITELTSLLSRRSVYCSKYPNGRYSITHFDDAEGNIRFRRTEHTWKGGKCVWCSASKGQYDRDKELESHAYEFIHLDNPEEIFKMKFDVIISNPPYQLSDGGAQASAKPIYQKFVEMAKNLSPHYISMIIPARWMTGGKGLDKFREETIHDKHFTVLHDFANAEDCFTGVDIKGGVCYFLWEKDKEKVCDIYRHDSTGVIFSQRYLVEEDDDIFIRYPQLVSIKNKVTKNTDASFETLVSSRKPYGLASDFFNDTKKYGLPPISDTPIKGGYSILGLIALKRVVKYIPNDYPLPKKDGINKYKLFVTNSYGCGEIGEGPATPVLATPVLATPGELCTETFLEIGPFDTRIEAENAMSYLKTKFFRCLVGIRKQTQHATKQVYHYVPMQDFSKPWTDEELYAKYDLTDEEIAFIESMIKPMDLSSGGDD